MKMAPEPEKENPPLRFEMAVSVRPPAQKRKPEASASKTRQQPTGVRETLILAHRFQGMIENGEVESFEALAQRFGVTYCRVGQLMNLTLLAPLIKAHILSAPIGKMARLRERHLRPIAARILWSEQVVLWKKLVQSNRSEAAASEK